LPRDLRLSWEGLHKRAPSDDPTGKEPSELDPATKEAMQSALDVQSTFLDTSRSTSASQLQEYLQVAPVQQFPENHIVEQSGSR
jgi:hypothetical protein